MTSILPGMKVTITKNTIYALPPRRTFGTISDPTATLEYSLDGSTFVAGTAVGADGSFIPLGSFMRMITSPNSADVLLVTQ